MQQEAFIITLKYHNNGFASKIKCRLNNTTKTNVSKVAKKILDKLIDRIKIIIKLNQWINPHYVTNWFNKFKNKAQFY